MKKFVSYFLVLSQVFFIPRATSADELEELIAATEKQRDTIRDYFPGYIESNVKQNIKTDYFLNSFDHLSTKMFLENKAHLGLIRLKELETKLDLTRSRLADPESAGWDQAAVDLFGIAVEAQSKVHESSLIAKDADLVRGSWKNKCEPKQIDYVNAKFDPLAIIRFINASGGSGVEPNFEIGMEVTLNDDGKATSAVTPQPNSGVSEEEAAVVSIAVGAAISVFCGPAFSACYVIASAVVLGLYGLYKFLFWGAQKAKIAEQEGKLYDLQQEIWDLQVRAASVASAKSPTWTKESCESSFPKDVSEKLYVANFDVYRTQSQLFFEIAKAAQAKAASDLQLRYKKLFQEYFPAVGAKYYKLIEDRFKAMLDANAKVKKLIDEDLKPALAEIQTQKDKALFSTRARQNYWSEIIKADVQYRTQRGFSFSNEAVNPTEFGNLWDDFGPKAIGVLK